LGILAGSALLSLKFNLSLSSTVAVASVLLACVLLGFRLTIGNLDHFLDLLPTTHRLRQFLAQLLPYQVRPSLMGKAVAWSLIVQVGASLSVGLMARGVGVALEWITWFSVVPLIALAIVLPISINGVGIREGGMVFLLGQWGVAEEKAVAVGLLWFFATIVTGLFGGVLFLIDRQSTKSVLADTTSRS
ncbi:MAG: flippase-like domain-containing protein, partial [Pirellulales bacterium]|nr:flippase-like domain-containing protein [Pirellulales bacterium]